MKVAIGLANMQRFGQRMHLMNGENFESMTQKKSITNYYENEHIIMRHINMLSLFVFQFVKKDGSPYPPTR